MSRHTSTCAARTTKPCPLPPALRIPALNAAILGTAGLAMGLPAWAAPAQGRSVIHATTFPVLAKLVERYGQPSLHWSRRVVETFIARDENITCRCRTSAGGAVQGLPEKVGRRS